MLDTENTQDRIESRPFEAPTTGKIAVNVISYYGDELMKMFDV